MHTSGKRGKKGIDPAGERGKLHSVRVNRKQAHLALLFDGRWLLSIFHAELRAVQYGVAVGGLSSVLAEAGYDGDQSFVNKFTGGANNAGKRQCSFFRNRPFGNEAFACAVVGVLTENQIYFICFCADRDLQIRCAAGNIQLSILLIKR